MITAEPVRKHGRTGGDRALLPADEYALRIDALRAAMDAEGIAGLVVVDEAARTGHVAYLAGPIEPKAAVVLVGDREPVLAAVTTPRDLPFLCSQSFIADVRNVPELARSAAEALAPILGELLPDSARLAVLGATFPGRDTCDAAGLIDPLRRRKRPRERAVLDLAEALARRAAEAALEAFSAGATNSEAALEADRVARLGGAYDVRVLANLHGEHLAPREGRGPGRRETLCLYCSVNYLGYWAEATAMFPVELGVAASRVVAAMAAEAVPGAVTGDLAAAALDAVEEGERALAQSYGFGAGIGMSRAEVPSLDPGGREELRAGDVLALHVVSRFDGRLGCAARSVVVGDVPAGGR